MPKQSTNDLIDTISEVIREFGWGQYAPGLETAIADDPDGCVWITDLAREIAKAVR
jgi:hypothetical protein